MDDADRRLIQAIQGMQDPDRDTPRTDEEDSDHDCEPQKQEEQQPPDMVRLQQDMALRQHLGIGGAFTGPKGVIADHKFHTQQELLRASQKLDEYIAKISKSALKSGSIARQIALESISNQDSHEEELLKIRATRRTQMHLQAEMSQVQTLTLQTFNVQIENEDPLVPVIVHIHTQSTACSHVNALLHLLAADYLMVKFATITAQEAADFDAFGTPAILMYQAGGMSHILSKNYSLL